MPQRTSITQIEGLRNFSQNIQSTMEKLSKSTLPTVKLTQSEAKNIVNYYIEVLDYLSKHA